jgi:hypothetical protein
MNRNRKLAALIFAILFIFAPDCLVEGQTRPRTRPRPPATAPASTPSAAKVPVIVNYKDGRHINGTFLGADGDTVRILAGSKRISIRVTEVFSIVFEAEEEAAEGKSVEEGEAKSVENLVKTLESEAVGPSFQVARKAYNSLLRLAEAIEIRVPYSQYSSQLFETKTIVAEATAALPDGAVKIDLNHALEVFTDAARAWGAVTQFGPYAGRIPIDTEPGATLMRKYKIKPELNAVAQADHLKLDAALKTIASSAEIILKNIDSILGH